MAIIFKRLVSQERVLQCDKCKKTKPYSLKHEFEEIRSNKGDSWLFGGGERFLCPACVRLITEAWYNQQEVVSFQLEGSLTESKSSEKIKACCGQIDCHLYKLEENVYE